MLYIVGLSKGHMNPSSFQNHYCMFSLDLLEIAAKSPPGEREHVR